MVRLARELGPQAQQPSREQDLRNFLGTFNFSGDMVMQAVGTMSGGEKARLVLCMIVWQRPNLLLLDEPTNHLDLATREALAMALNEFEGTVMLVSHDRALLRSVCDEFWMVGRGQVQPFDGDLDDYQRYLLEESRRLRDEARQALAASTALSAAAPAAAPVAASPAAAPAAPVAPAAGPAESSKPASTATVTAGDVSQRDQRKQDAQRRQELAAQLRPLKRELEQNEKRTATLESERTDLEARLANPIPASELADAGRRLKAINDEIATLEERWLLLQEEIEQASV